MNTHKKLSMSLDSPCFLVQCSKCFLYQDTTCIYCCDCMTHCGFFRFPEYVSTTKQGFHIFKGLKDKDFVTAYQNLYKPEEVGGLILCGPSALAVEFFTLQPGYKPMEIIE